jgi:hypothetical protein
MSGKPQMLCCAALPAEHDRTLGPMLTRPLLIRADFDRVPISGRRFLHREGPLCWLHGSIHTCVYVRHPR